MGSSKAERNLARVLHAHGFRRNYPVSITKDSKPINIDIFHFAKHVWIESDGRWHFMQLKDGHEFAAAQAKDAAIEQEAIKRNILLIRVNNDKFNIDEQLAFIFMHMNEWDGKAGKVVKLY